MSIYNGERFLEGSIDSILSQTFRDFEFIIINDGSKDKSEKIVHNKHDTRIHYYKNKRNIGLPASLNKAIAIARGKYLLRMDQDDISFPERFKTQIEYMETHKDIDICGTAFYSEVNGKKSISRPITNPEEIKAALLFRNVTAHSSVIMRKSSLDKYIFRYNPCVKNAEDYELWTRCCWKLNISNIKKPLIYYRKHPDQMTKKDNLQAIVERSRNVYVAKFIENAKVIDLERHSRICSGIFTPSWTEFNAIEKWLKRLVLANKKKSLVDNQAMMNVISSQWLTICLKSSRLGKKIIIKYLHSALAPKSSHKWKYTALLIYKVFKP